MTLTNDRLKQITDAISAEPHDYESIYDSITHGEIAAMARELLANREAQPVAWRHDDGPFAGIAITRAKSVADSWIDNGWTVTPLYTAQPAPAVPAVLAQPVSGGYKLVPVEATEDMIAAAMNCDDVSFNADETFCVNFGNIYAAMLASAPEGGNG